MDSGIRIADIEARRKSIDAQIVALQREAEEIEITLRVLKRFPAGKEGQEPEQTSNKSGPPRPDGTPTLFEMVSLILSSARREGKLGLTGREIVDEIGRRYWPGVQSQQVLPTVYRFVKETRLGRQDGKFVLKDKAPPDDSESASKNTVESGSSTSIVSEGVAPQ